MTRTNARQLALQLSFAVSAGSDVGPDAFFDEDYFRALPAEDALFTEIPGEEERAYINALVTGVRDHREELDDLIEQFSHGWKLSRISRTALAVLRVALYEILYMPDIPAAASINEAVELAKGYDEPETVRFINGILGSFMRSRGETIEEQPAETEPAEDAAAAGMDPRRKNDGDFAALRIGDHGAHPRHRRKRRRAAPRLCPRRAFQL